MTNQQDAERLLREAKELQAQADRNLAKANAEVDMLTEQLAVAESQLKAKGYDTPEDAQRAVEAQRSEAVEALQASVEALKEAQ